MIDEFDKKKDIQVVDNNGMVTRGQNEKKALHQVLSKATVFTSFDLFLAELPFPVICTKHLGPDTWSVSVNSTNGGKH